MLKCLSQSPETWTKIYCLSRRPPAVPGALPPNAEFISVDFLDEPSKIAAVLKEHNVTASVLPAFPLRLMRSTSATMSSSTLTFRYHQRREAPCGRMWMRWSG
jgi:hypothetical protein